jgi:hypothetical protein
VDLDFLSEAAGWLLKRVTIELVAESAGADAQELGGSLAMLIALGEGREDGCFFGLLNGCLEARRHRTAKTCLSGKYLLDPIVRMTPHSALPPITARNLLARSLSTYANCSKRLLSTAHDVPYDVQPNPPT